MERKISNVLLGIADSEDRFTLKHGWFRFRLKIKPISAKQLIAISSEVAQVRNVEQEQDMFPALMNGVADVRYIARVVAIATGTRYRKIVTRAILKLPLKDIQTLFAIVLKQSDPSPFFLTCLQIGKLNILKKKEE